jgi:hypothetical protein
MTIAERLIAHLWPHDDSPATPQVYALLDGARDRRIVPMVRASGLEHRCLYSGSLSEPLERAAPYLVHLTPTASFTMELLQLAWGQSWGILTTVLPDCTIDEQRRHLRTLLRVRTEDGRALVFRFYDPRVLRIYLPTCTADETRSMFGPIAQLLAESAGGRRVCVYTPGEAGATVSAIDLS